MLQSRIKGSALPDLVGYYIFGDFGSGRIWAVPADSPVGTAPIEIADTNLSIVVPQDRTEEAVGRLHKEFFEPQAVTASNS